jgi:outer membrane protein assembly factor BamB
MKRGFLLIIASLFFIGYPIGFSGGQPKSGTAISSSSGVGDLWSQYRGPNRDGVSRSKASVNVWSGQMPKLLWKQAIGDGFSGILVAGQDLITAFAVDSTEFLASHDRVTGMEKWRLKLGKMFIDDFGNGPRSTPTLDGDRVFALGSYGDLYAVDIESGQSVWTFSLTDEFEAKVPRRGFTTSPFVQDDLVIVQAGGGEGEAFAALDKKTGKISWKTGDGAPSYSSPVSATIGGVTQNIFCSARTVQEDSTRKTVSEIISVGPAGKILWQGLAPNTIFVSSSTDDGCLALRVEKAGGTFSVEEAWRSREMINHFNSSVYYEGHIYGFSKSTLKCLEAATSKRKWRKRGFGKGSLIVVDDKLLVLSDRGKLAIIQATGEGYYELAAGQVLNGKSWTCPTFADGKIYLRNRTEMACYDIGS